MHDLTPTPRPVLLSTRASGRGGFQDTSVVLHLVGDPSDPEYSPERWDESRVGLHQDHDGPTHLIIGRRAPAEALQRAAHRLAIDVRSLQRFQAEAINHG
jgi:hypothetical protein